MVTWHMLLRTNSTTKCCAAMLFIILFWEEQPVLSAFSVGLPQYHLCAAAVAEKAVLFAVTELSRNRGTCDHP